MWEVEMAKMFKERDKETLIGPCIGKVISSEPLKISILDGDIMLQEEQLYVTRSLKDRDFELKIKDEVLIIPAINEQTFFIIDIVQKVGE